MEFTRKLIVDINKAVNETYRTSAYWVKESLVDSAISAYSYYEDELDQVCSVFRGIVKNHAFSNGNKRTGALLLGAWLLKQGYIPEDGKLAELVLDVASHNYEVEEISEKVKELCIDK